MELMMLLMEKQVVRQADVDALPWHHQIDFGNGVLSNGNTKIPVLMAQADVYFRAGIRGKSVLDVGCWDGFNSFEAERRGAKRVLATDHFAWSEQCWGDRQSIELAKRALGSSIEIKDVGMDDIAENNVGYFDVVIFAGVFYHLRNPFSDLERISKLVTDTIIVETHMDALDYPRPAMVFYPTAELANDPTNWWGPNRSCVEGMLKDCGFRTVEFTAHPVYPNRGIFHGIR